VVTNEPSCTHSRVLMFEKGNIIVGYKLQPSNTNSFPLISPFDSSSTSDTTRNVHCQNDISFVPYTSCASMRKEFDGSEYIDSRKDWKPA
jgi:hypothetical protein